MDEDSSYDVKQHERIAEILYDVARVTDLPQDSSQIYSRLRQTIRDMRTVLRAVANCEYRMGVILPGNCGTGT